MAAKEIACNFYVIYKFMSLLVSFLIMWFRWLVWSSQIPARLTGGQRMLISIFGQTFSCFYHYNYDTEELHKIIFARGRLYAIVRRSRKVWNSSRSTCEHVMGVVVERLDDPTQ